MIILVLHQYDQYSDIVRICLYARLYIQWINGSIFLVLIILTLTNKIVFETMYPFLIFQIQNRDIEF